MCKKKKTPRRLTFPSLYLFRTCTSLKWNKLELFCHSSVEEEWNRLKNHSGVKNCWTSLLHQTICWNPPLVGCRDCLQIAQDKKKSLSSISADLQFSAFRLLPLCLPPPPPLPPLFLPFLLHRFIPFSRLWACHPFYPGRSRCRRPWGRPSGWWTRWSPPPRRCWSPSRSSPSLLLHYLWSSVSGERGPENVVTVCGIFISAPCSRPFLRFVHVHSCNSKNKSLALMRQNIIPVKCMNKW